MTSRERRCTVNYILCVRRVQSMRRRLSNLSQPLALHRGTASFGDRALNQHGSLDLQGHHYAALMISKGTPHGGL